MADAAATDVQADAPLVVGIGGTIGGISSTERALRIALDAAGREGFRTRMFGGADMAKLPLYDPKATTRTPDEIEFVETVRQASALIIASPGYHGSISGVVKNALDLLEETARDVERPYLADMPVGLIATAYGWQATGSTIAALRSIVHALRGWPTPFAAAINSQLTKFDEDGGASEPAVLEQLCMVGRQVARFAPLSIKTNG
ncbi:NAD(P)H-dependent oxidoreductase [Sphingomonas sp. So64.6b]|uniref:NADPH-dependent FMN reductase n=1 Tax=Sphingomonas sp. So64.6b TaxID=2997354 RepID=UPI001601715C|nr:NADPH-dependent FMN reductase [Sphingomonas sp. So64.6b]QNA86101.1 NAD(P)H-dependent oxidoreductase [Sphingomonas sp. So64.6b]